MSPNEAEASLKVRERIRREARGREEAVDEKVDLKVGDRVRVLKRKGLFQKEGAIWSDSVYTIVATEMTSFLVSGLSRAYKIDELQKVGEVQDNPKERVATSFDVEQHLERARNARGKKKKTVVEPNKTELRKERKATDRLVIADTGSKVYKKGVLIQSVWKKYEKKDYFMFKPGVFVAIRNAPNYRPLTVWAHTYVLG